MASSDIEKKVMDQPVASVSKVAVAYSGGLDSSLAIELLRRVYKAKEIVPITIDVGQGQEALREPGPSGARHVESTRSRLNRCIDLAAIGGE